MSLKEQYAKAWRKDRGLNHGWIVNLEPTQSLPLGAVGVVSEGEFANEASLVERGVTGLETLPEQNRDGTPWAFQSNEDIAYSIGASARVDGVAAKILDPEFSIGVEFGKSEGALSTGSAMWWDRYRDIGKVRTAIVQAAREHRLHKGTSIVVERQLTGAGVVFVSKGSNGKLEVKGSAKVAPGITPPIASLAGNLSIVHSAGAATIAQFADDSVLAARVLYLGTRGWFWWKDFAAYGSYSDDLEQAEEIMMKAVEGDGEDEYFALLD